MHHAQLKAGVQQDRHGPSTQHVGEQYRRNGHEEYGNTDFLRILVAVFPDKKRSSIQHFSFGDGTVDWVYAPQIALLELLVSAVQSARSYC